MGMLGKPKCALPIRTPLWISLFGGNPKWEGEGPDVPVKEYDALFVTRNIYSGPSIPNLRQKKEKETDQDFPISDPEVRLMIWYS